MPLTFIILIVTGEATPSTDTGAVIGGTILGAIALMALVIPLLGCLIYCKKRKSRKLHIKYSVYSVCIFRNNACHLECFTVVGEVLEELLLCQSPTQNAC